MSPHGLGAYAAMGRRREVPCLGKGPGGGPLVPSPRTVCRGVRAGETRVNPRTGFTVLVETFLAEEGWAVTAALCRAPGGEPRVIEVGRLSADYEPLGGGPAPVTPLNETEPGRWHELFGAGAAELAEAGYPDIGAAGPGRQFVRAYLAASKFRSALVLVYKDGRGPRLWSAAGRLPRADGPWLAAKSPGTPEEGRKWADRFARGESTS